MVLRGARVFFLVLSGCVFSPALKAWPTITLEPVLDNTLYETAADQPDNPLEMSNGVGSFLFAGRTGLDAGFRVRRALLKFDPDEGLPPGAIVLSVSLTLYQSKAAPGSPTVEMELFRVLNAWGEGASDGIGAEGQGNFAEAGDATWFHRIYPDLDWDSAGGDAASVISASALVGQVLQHYTWTCTQAMIADVQAWLDDPEQNHGWVIIGGEQGGQSAHRFNSRHHPDPVLRPRLHIAYQPQDGQFSDGFDDPVSCP